MSPTPWASTHWATLLLCSHVATQIHIHSALSPASSNSFPAWLPPMLMFLSPKSLSHGSPPASPFSTTRSPLCFSDSSSPSTATSSALVQLCPGPAFHRLLLLSPSSFPGPSISSSSGSGPHSHGGPAAEGSQAHTLTAVSQVVRPGSCKESRAGRQAGPSALRHAELPGCRPHGSSSGLPGAQRG